MHAAHVRKEPVQGSRYKYIEMFSRVCDLEAVDRFPLSRRHDLGIMVGLDKQQYRDLTGSGTPYIFVANDVAGMRWADKRAYEKQVILNAGAVMANTPGTLAWLQKEYGLEGGEVVHLRPLEQDLDFEPLPKLPGRNIAYAGGIVAGNPRYDYRDYREIFKALIDVGWTVHVYPSWGHTREDVHYSAIGCVVHEPVEEGATLYRELSQYQAGFQGYAYGTQQHYIEVARPNKLWEYLAAGIPTLGYNTGGGGRLYDGKWGLVAQSLEELGEVSERVLRMRVTDSMRRRQVIDADLEVFERLVTKVCPPLRVGVLGKGDIAGQVSMVPPEVRKLGIECYGYSVAQSKFDYPRDEHGKDTAFLADADIIHVAVTHTALNYFPQANPNARLVIHQHGHMDRKGDAPRSELELDRQRGATRIVSTLNLLPYVDGDASRWAPSMLNPFIETIEREPRNDGRVLVVHSPSMRERKHTTEIITAVEALQARGMPVDLEIIEKVSNDECIRRKARADICFDQLLCCYGTSAVEAMYLGIPVIVGLDDETDETIYRVTGCRPYVRATPETLESVLAELVRNKRKRDQLGMVGKLYARKYHTPAAVAERRAELYRTVCASRLPQALPLVEDAPDTGGPYRMKVDVLLDGVMYRRGVGVYADTVIAMWKLNLIKNLPRELQGAV